MGIQKSVPVSNMLLIVSLQPVGSVLRRFPSLIRLALSSLGEGSSENFMTSSTFTPWRKEEDRRRLVSISQNASSGNDFADHTVTPSLNDVRRSGTLNAHGMFDFIYVVLQER